MCNYCNGKKPLISLETSCPIYFFGKIIEYERAWLVIADRGYLRLCDADDMQCLDHGENIKINYCPMCGKEF